MNIVKTLAVVGLGLMWGTMCFAQQLPAGAPAGTTAVCRDGSYWSGATKRGACRGHKGVKTWYGAAGGSAATAAPSPGAAPTASSAMGAPVAARAARGAPRATTAAAVPGGGPGMVWVNHRSKVYHCFGDRYYGKTRSGEYMSEADAAAKGYRPDHGKRCK
jgi:hypothetical protein